MKKRGRLQKWIAALLSVVLMLGCLPVSAAEQMSFFYLSAIGNGRVIIAPERVAYREGQTVGEALAASGHSFSGLESGMIDTIDGVVGNYTRSDEDGGYDLKKPASEVEFYCFSDSENSCPSADLQLLIRIMADYTLEDEDVRTAAQMEYEQAYSRFPGISDDSARSCAVALTNAMETYLENQNGVKYAVTFSSAAGLELVAENPYGKVFEDGDMDGVLQLPADTYTFRVIDGGRRVSGQIEVGADMRVSVTIPTADWLVMETAAFSGAYGEENFVQNKFSAAVVDSRTICVTVPDGFTGNVYAYLEYNENLAYGSVPAVDAVYIDTAGAEKLVEQAFFSYKMGAKKVLERGATGNVVIYRVSTTDENGFVLSQDYTVEFLRTPTLSALAVVSGKTPQTPQQSFDGETTSYTYRVLSTVKELAITPTPLDPSYTVMVNDTVVENGSAVTVPLDSDAAQTDITVTVSGSGFTTTYILAVIPGTGRRITFNTTASDILLRVVNKNGDELAFTKEKNNEGGNSYQYTLVPGEVYTYVANKNNTYFASKEFTLEESANAVISVKVKTEDWLSELALGTDAGKDYKNSIPLEETFAPADHDVSAQILDTENSLYLWVTAVDGVKIAARYAQLGSTKSIDGVEKNVSLSSGKVQGTKLPHVLMAMSGYGNPVTVRLSQTDKEDGVTYFQDYHLNLEHVFTLRNLSAEYAGSETPVFLADGTQGYVRGKTDYIVTVPDAAESLTVSVPIHTAENNTNVRYGETSSGYRVCVNGTDVTETGKAMVVLNGTKQTETVEILLTNDHVPEQKTVYTLQVAKAAPIAAAITLQPQDALLAVREAVSGNRLWPENGVYMLSDGFRYTYTLTQNGFVGKAGTLETTRDEEGSVVVLLDNEPVNVVAEGESLSAAWTMTLEQAPGNEKLDKEIVAQWPDFRGNADNNGIVDAPTPVSAESSTLYWATKIGSGYGSKAAGCPIIVDGDLITYSSDTIYRLDAVSGEILAWGQMDHNSNFSITPPAYYEGMVFIGLSDGTVQAFDAKTLQSLWIYRDPLGGQPNSPLTICNGYLYTGFWNAENTNANFACLSLTDEDPTQEKEEKIATWYHTQKGGFYWAGAYACEDYILVGTDDGFGGYTEQTSMLLLMDPLTGEIYDRWTGLDADVRSTVVRDEKTGKFYFTSKGGSFYTVSVVQTTDGWSISGKRRLELDNGVGGVPMSTSSPVIYNGRAYIGVSGEAQFTPYSGHNITVIDLDSWNVAYRVETQGYPQTSGLLTTAYEEQTGSVYVYFFDNQTPGKLRVLQDRKGQTEPTLMTVENGKQLGYALFTPTGEQAEYAICSPIVDEYGVIYFKNDTASVMAFGPAIKELIVEQQPEKTEYAVGEKFDPKGMRVLLRYANGKTRDVTDYITWPEAELEEGQTTVTLSFPHVMYHNAAGEGGTMTSGVVTQTPTVNITISVGAAEQKALGDVNADGKIDSSDAVLILQANASGELIEDLRIIADVNADGFVDSSDAVLVLQYSAGTITEFPAERAE